MEVKNTDGKKNVDGQNVELDRSKEKTSNGTKRLKDITSNGK
jgi:hypothetical protein